MSDSKSDRAVFYGVGVGPGDPELITLKAARIIQSADVICYLVNEKGDSQSLYIAKNIVSERSKDVIHFPILMPMDRDPKVGSAVYNKAANSISAFFMAPFKVVTTELMSLPVCKIISHSDFILFN